jgi:hypothetical protein
VYQPNSNELRAKVKFPKGIWVFPPADICAVDGSTASTHAGPASYLLELVGADALEGLPAGYTKMELVK